MKFYQEKWEMKFYLKKWEIKFRQEKNEKKSILFHVKKG